MGFKFNGGNIKETNSSVFRNKLFYLKTRGLLFKGILGDNIDPFKTFSEVEIVKVLAYLDLINFVKYGNNSQTPNYLVNDAMRPIIRRNMHRRGSAMFQAFLHDITPMNNVTNQSISSSSSSLKRLPAIPPRVSTCPKQVSTSKIDEVDDDEVSHREKEQNKVLDDLVRLIEGKARNSTLEEIDDEESIQNTPQNIIFDSRISKKRNGRDSLQAFTPRQNDFLSKPPDLIQLPIPIKVSVEEKKISDKEDIIPDSLAEDCSLKMDSSLSSDSSSVRIFL